MVILSFPNGKHKTRVNITASVQKRRLLPFIGMPFFIFHYIGMRFILVLYYFGSEEFTYHLRMNFYNNQAHTVGQAFFGIFRVRLYITIIVSRALLIKGTPIMPRGVCLTLQTTDDKNAETIRQFISQLEKQLASRL